MITSVDRFTKFTLDSFISHFFLLLGGLTPKIQVPLPGESEGSVPNPGFLRTQGLHWNSGFTTLTAIGQGVVETTPLQMTTMISTIAKGGKVYQPRLIDKIGKQTQAPKMLDNLVDSKGITAKAFEVVRKGTWSRFYRENK